MRTTNILLFTLFAFSAHAQGRALSIEQVLDAAGSGKLVTLKKYHSKKGDLNAQDSHGLTPLMQAVATGQKKVVDYLLQQKVNLELKNANGDTALAMAIGNEQDQIAVALINAGAKVDVLGGEDKNNLVFMAASVNATKTLQLLTKKAPEQINMKNKNGDMPLHEAARFGTEKTLEVLLNAGAKKEIVNNFGKTPLDLAKSINNKAAVRVLSRTTP
ncbi:MAG TPA: ankyrin repeat domain-containing protein [Pseudobdellovibrionaceae bacterium]|jgi:ankyrin repeat protein